MTGGTKISEDGLSSSSTSWTVVSSVAANIMSVETSDDFDPQATLKGLQSSLDALEAFLQPVLNSKWEDTLESVDGTLDKAKMDVLLAYAINDLVWTYLKTKGIDPSTHDVTAELERIKTYYAKVREIENPAKRKIVVNQPAAARIIKHAIPGRQRIPQPSSTGAEAGPSTSAAGLLQASVAAVQQDIGDDDDDEGLSRRSTRFKFISDRSAKVLPDVAEDGSDDEEEEDGPLGEQAEGEHTRFDAMDIDEVTAMAGDADEFLREIEDQLSVPPASSLESPKPKSGQASKRRRAEDML